MFFWPYTLRSRSVLNARSIRHGHRGALIRLEAGGVGCLHPWPELGDPDIDDLLRTLAAGKEASAGERLIVQALRCAEADGAARTGGRSLFRSLTIPESHATIPDPAAADFDGLLDQGFTHVKIKINGSKTDSAAAGITGLGRAADAGLRLRPDANLTFRDSALRAFLRSLPENVTNAFDFIEDPSPWIAGEWHALRKEFGIRLALDRPTADSEHGYDVRVIKPAVMCSPSSSGHDIVFTSYMDHPVGQMWAAACAAACPLPQLTAGLLTHGLFEPDDWLEQITNRGPRLIPPPGTGLGFDELIDRTPWQKL